MPNYPPTNYDSDFGSMSRKQDCTSLWPGSFQALRFCLRVDHDRGILRDCEQLSGYQCSPMSNRLNISF